MKRVTQEYVIQCINNERTARARHREHNTDATWAEKQACIRETNDALKRYPGKVQMTQGLRA